jgi:hypothetical protein
MPELNHRPLPTAAGGLGFVVQAFGVVVRPHLQTVECVNYDIPTRPIQLLQVFSKGVYLDCVVLEVRVIKRWLVRDVHAVYHVPVWTLQICNSQIAGLELGPLELDVRLEQRVSP